MAALPPTALPSSPMGEPDRGKIKKRWEETVKDSRRKEGRNYYMRPNKRKRSAIKKFQKSILFGECSKVKSVIDLKIKKLVA